MRMSPRRTALRAVLAVTTIAVTGSGALVAPVAASPASDKSAGWLADQLDSGLIVSEYNLHDGNGWQQYTDQGLTLDVYYALGQLDTRPAKRAAILAALEGEAAAYIDGFGRSAGAIGKLLTAVELAGGNPHTYGDGDEDYLAGLEDLVVVGGDEGGRAKDDPSGFSNTFTQAYDATALAGAGSTSADEATTFLLKQQCDAGFFREDVTSSDFTCDSGTGDESTPSVDATATVAVALAALSSAPSLPNDVRADAAQALTDALAWLSAKQRDDGAFVGNGVANTNSTGLAASAFIIAGREGKARKAAAWIDRLRVTPRLVRTTAFKAADLGAVAYGSAALAKGKTKGMLRADRYEWRRATAQAAPALDLIG